MLVCLILASVLEGFGLAALIPLVQVALGPEGGDPPADDPSPLEGAARRTLATLGIPETLEVLSLVVLGILAVKAAVVLLSKRQVGYTSARIVTDMRQELLRALLSAQWGYFTRQPVGRIANAVGTEADRAGRAYAKLTQIAQHAAMTLAYVTVAVALSWELLLGAAVSAVVIWVMLGGLVRSAGRAGSRQTELTKSLLSRLADSMQSFRLLKAMGLERLVGPLLARDTDRLQGALRSQVLAREALQVLQEPLLAACVIGLMIYAVRALGMGSGEIFVLVMTFARGIQSSNKIQRKYQEAAIHASAVWSMRELIDGALANVEVHPGCVTPSLERSIEVAGVCVDFDGRRVLHDVSLTIPAGQITAIVGESGAGKTTLMDVLTGLVTPDAGEIRVDGIPLAEIDLAAWRQRVGLVPQELLLLHESVRFNVTLGDPQLDDADVERALRSASAWEFVNELPGGLDASAGERGTLLSGGQRGRIALARALAHRPALLILDEATAALDPQAERAVWDAIARLRGEATVVAISHQPALTELADRIYLIEGGTARRVDEPGRARKLPSSRSGGSSLTT